MSNKKSTQSAYCKYVKRILDIIFSTLLIALLSPVMVIIGVAIRVESSGGAIFKQKRVGQNKKAFVCLKFRTMRIDAPQNVPASKLLDSQKYITRVGRLLRRSSLDELPQLFNVLKGDMSLVGPRPLIFEEAEMHKKRESEGIYALRPGLTGLAQIKGRNLLLDCEKIENDKFYLENIKIRLDARIVFLTLGCVFVGKGIVPENIEK